MMSTPFTPRLLLPAAVGLSLLSVPFCCEASALAAGERHLIAHEASAKVRDSQHRDQLRITIWYPAANRSHETPLAVGPEGHPFFLAGASAQDAPFADEEQHPVILLSHGFGGTARIMAWFGTAIARAGYIVIAVDHPGNNGLDPMTVAGAELFWERPADLTVALRRVSEDPEFSRHLNLSRIGVAGFSAGGFTALAAAGGRIDISRLLAFCKSHTDDGVCKPQREFAVTQAEAEAFLASSDATPSIRHSRGSFAIRGVHAVLPWLPRSCRVSIQ